jgi:hypothetical protein
VKFKAEVKGKNLESEHEKGRIMEFFNVKYYVHCNAVLIVNIFPA